MKIKLSDYEEYVLRVKDSYEPDEFFEFVERLNQLSKMVRKDFVSDMNKEITNTNKNLVKEKIKGRTKKRIWCDSKEKVIHYMKIHYFGNKEDQIKISKQIGVSWFEISKSFHGLKERYNIKPKDLNLKYFPNIRTNKIQVVEQAKIK
jgi:hypothetical protein